LERTTMMNDYWRARFSGPIAPYADGLRAELLALAYAPSTVTSHLGLWAQLDRWLVDRGLAVSELTAVRIEEFLVERGQTSLWGRLSRAWFLDCGPG